MTGRVGGKVAFITGATRGQGRSHVIRLSQESADTVAVDLCTQVGSVDCQRRRTHDLARLGRGRLARIRSYRDVAPALSRLFAE